MSHSWRRDASDSEQAEADDTTAEPVGSEGDPTDEPSGAAAVAASEPADDGTVASSPFAPGQPFAGAGGPPHTGDPAVDSALAGAAAAQGLEPAEQLEVYVGTHRALQDRLADSGA